MDAFFRVDSDSAASSGRDRYEAKVSFRDVGLILGTGYEITEHWTLGLRLVYRRLAGEAPTARSSRTAARPTSAAPASARPSTFERRTRPLTAFGR
jgi:hypothetical protein